MAKRWLVYSRGINADDCSEYVTFKEVRTVRPDPHKLYDPNCIEDGATNRNNSVVQVELDPPPILSVVCLGNPGIKYMLSSQDASRFKTISELFENFWEKLPQFHKKSREVGDGCSHCRKERWNEIVSGRCLNWSGGANTIQLCKKKSGRWFLCVETIKVLDDKDIRINSEFEVSRCPWCGRVLN